MVDDPLEQCQQRLVASLDRAVQHAAHTDPFLYVRLERQRQRLAANLTAPRGLATAAEAAEARRQ